MRKQLLIFISVAILSVSCTHRPVRDDVRTPDGPATRQANVGDEIQSSPGAATAPFEQRFIDTLIELDLHAIDAEQMVATRAGHVELKQFSRTTIKEQQQDIATLRQLRTASFDDQPKAFDLDLVGAKDALHAIDLVKLDPLKENIFDLEFIDQLTTYLDSINRMSAVALGKDLRGEIKQIAQKVVAANSSKLEQMKKWEAQWKKG